MSRFYRLIPVLFLLILCLLTASCGEEPTDTTTAAPVTTGEVATTTAATSAATTTTAPVVTAAPNPITEVKKMKNGELRLTYENGDTAKMEASLPIREGYNSITYTYALNKSTSTLALTLCDGAGENIALSHLSLLPEKLTVLLREENGALHYAYEGEDSWRYLCPADSNAILLALSEATEFGKTEAVTGNGVTFVISGNNLRFRAHNWVHEGYDICNDAILQNTSINGNFLFQEMREISSTLPLDSMDKGTSFKAAGDEIPAININGTYIAAAHGYYCISAVPNTLGLSEEDIGVVFTRESDDQTYVLVKLPTDGTAWFCPFDDAAMESGDFGRFSSTGSAALLAADDRLVYTPVGGRERTVTISANATLTQFRPSTNHRVQRAFLNGTIEVDLTKDGVYTADYVDFYETYDVIYLPTILENLMDNAGYNTNDSHHSEDFEEAYLSYVHTHRMHKNGSFTVYQDVVAKTTLRDVDYFGVMSMALPGTEQYVYAPNSTNLSIPTLQTNQSVYAEGGVEVNSFYHLTDTAGTKGVNVGYYPYFGVARPEVRALTVTARGGKAGYWYTSRKMYPYLYHTTRLAEGEKISFIGYHVPTIKLDDDFFAVNWYFVGDEIYLSLHTDHAVAQKTVTLPSSDYLNGATIAVEEANGGFAVHSSTIENGSISVSCTGAGHITLKLTFAE